MKENAVSMCKDVAEKKVRRESGSSDNPGKPPAGGFHVSAFQLHFPLIDPKGCINT